MSCLFLSWLYYCLRCAFASIANVKFALSANVLLFKKNLNNLVILLIVIMENENHDIVTYSDQNSSDESYFRPLDGAKKEILKLKGQKNKNPDPVKSVKSMPAQFAGLCDLRSLQNLTDIVNSLLSDSNTEISVLEKAVIELQFLYGLRISEVLSIKPVNVLWNASINVKGLKGSGSRIVYPVLFKHFWLYMRNNNIVIPSNYNRFYFYRLYKKKGLNTILGSNNNNSVTHVLRYGYIHKLLNSGLKIEEIQHLLSHKSIKSSLHYVENLRKE